MYGFAENSPLVFFDVSGWTSVSIYDPNDKGGRGIADGKCFKFGAEETGDIVIPVEDAADAAEKLKGVKEELEAKGESIDTLSIWDHGSPGAQELGDENLDPNSPEWKDIASTVDPKGRIDLYGCETCKGRAGTKGVQDLADSADRLVTGCDATTDFEYRRGPFGLGRWNKTYNNEGKRYLIKPQHPGSGSNGTPNGTGPKSSE